jgi:hypothetical protein
MQATSIDLNSYEQKKEQPTFSSEAVAVLDFPLQLKKDFLNFD